MRRHTSPPRARRTTSAARRCATPPTLGAAAAAPPRARRRRARRRDRGRGRSPTTGAIHHRAAKEARRRLRVAVDRDRHAARPQPRRERPRGPQSAAAPFAVAEHLDRESAPPKGAAAARRPAARRGAKCGTARRRGRRRRRSPTGNVAHRPIRARAAGSRERRLFETHAQRGGRRRRRAPRPLLVADHLERRGELRRSRHADRHARVVIVPSHLPVFRESSGGAGTDADRLGGTPKARARAHDEARKCLRAFWMRDAAHSLARPAAHAPERGLPRGRRRCGRDEGSILAATDAPPGRRDDSVPGRPRTLPEEQRGLGSLSQQGAETSATWARAAIDAARAHSQRDVKPRRPASRLLRDRQRQPFDVAQASVHLDAVAPPHKGRRHEARRRRRPLARAGRCAWRRLAAARPTGRSTTGSSPLPSGARGVRAPLTAAPSPRSPTARAGRGGSTTSLARRRRARSHGVRRDPRRAAGEQLLARVDRAHHALDASAWEERGGEVHIQRCTPRRSAGTSPRRSSRRRGATRWRRKARTGSAGVEGHRRMAKEAVSESAGTV